MVSDTKIDPTTKEVLMLLGVGALILSSFVVPVLPMAVKPIIDFYERNERLKQHKVWNRFNQPRLKYLLKRLYKQKVVEIEDNEGESMVKLTDKGRRKLLKYKLEEIMIDKPPRWDGKWRIIIYDIKVQKRGLGEIFRSFLKKLEFLKLQKSIYLTPYSCKDQIEFLRQYHNLGEEVLYLEVNKLENEEVYKNYFGL